MYVFEAAVRFMFIAIFDHKELNTSSVGVRESRYNMTVIAFVTWCIHFYKVLSFFVGFSHFSPEYKVASTRVYYSIFFQEELSRRREYIRISEVYDQVSVMHVFISWINSMLKFVCVPSFQLWIIKVINVILIGIWICERLLFFE